MRKLNRTKSERRNLLVNISIYSPTNNIRRNLSSSDHHAKRYSTQYQELFSHQMSGAGRKSSYRKSVVDDYLNALPEPNESDGELVAHVGASRGSNVFEISIGSEVLELAILPNKFKKLIWVKRGDYVIASTR